MKHAFVAFCVLFAACGDDLASDTGPGDADVVDDVSRMDASDSGMARDADVPTDSGEMRDAGFDAAPLLPTHFVTTSGSSENDGLSEATAWSLVHAFATAQPGDVVYVKAGNYGNLNLRTSRPGTADEPIRFIGYTSVPGDIVAVGGPSFSFEDWKAGGNDLPDDVMPHLELNPANEDPDSGDVAFTLEHSYVELHNFMVSEFQTGFDVQASNVTLDNCIGDQFGNWDPSAIGWNDTSDGFDHTNRDGYAVRVTGGAMDCVLTNNLMIDAGIVSYFFIGGGGHRIDSCWGIAFRPGNGSDYIFDFFNSPNNTVTGCYAERSYGGGEGHRSRSLILQAQSDNNVINRFTGVNARLQIENADDNELRDLDLYTINGASGANSVSIQLYGGAERNLFYNVRLSGGGGVAFLGYDTNENQEPMTEAATDNWFVNFIVTDLNGSSGNAVIDGHRLGNRSVRGGTNYGLNWTVSNFEYLVNANRGFDFTLYNSTINGGQSSSIDTYYSGFSDARGDYTLRFENDHFNGNVFTTPSGTNLLNGDPGFTNAPGGDFTLLATSPLIDSGQDASALLPAATTDFAGGMRGVGGSDDIGAYEHAP